MGAVVTKDVQDNEVVTGNFAIPHEQFISNLKNYRSKND
jgi:UDP-3-O-[3-hydroxymyristoyl] glucosamine N-acyltransferase